MKVRALSAKDLRNQGILGSLLDTLESLSPRSSFTAERLQEVIFDRMKSGIVTYIAVIDTLSSDQVIGTASMVYERKLIHSGKLCGHIEDVAVHKDHQGKGIGKFLMEAMLEDAQNLGEVYKVILDCDDDLMPFYEKFGMTKVSNCMRIDIKADDMNAIDELIERLTLRGRLVPTRQEAACMVREASEMKDDLIEAFWSMSADELKAWEIAMTDELERRGRAGPDTA